MDEDVVYVTQPKPKSLIKLFLFGPMIKHPCEMNDSFSRNSA